jgi:hypothetical protein
MGSNPIARSGRNTTTKRTTARFLIPGQVQNPRMSPKLTDRTHDLNLLDITSSVILPGYP